MSKKYTIKHNWNCALSYDIQERPERRRKTICGNETSTETFMRAEKY